MIERLVHTRRVLQDVSPAVAEAQAEAVAAADAADAKIASAPAVEVITSKDDATPTGVSA